MNFSIHQTSHIGNRKFNQDRVAYAYTNDALLLVLADGMGGHLHGEMAASLTIETFVELFGLHAQRHIADPNEFLMGTMQVAHKRIMTFPFNKDSGGFPGTTCVAVLIQDGKMYSGHAGDSRLYLMRDGEVLIRTSDHSVVQQLVESGQISADDARIHPHRNQITNCLGGVDNIFRVEPGKPVSLKTGDVLLLCSDGLWGPFTDREIVEAFISMPVDEVMDDLVRFALEREQGHSDNVTGLAVRWGEGEMAHPTEELVSHILDVS